MHLDVLGIESEARGVHGADGRRFEQIGVLKGGEKEKKSDRAAVTHREGAGRRTSGWRPGRRSVRCP